MRGIRLVEHNPIAWTVGDLGLLFFSFFFCLSISQPNDSRTWFDGEGGYPPCQGRDIALLLGPVDDIKIIVSGGLETSKQICEHPLISKAEQSRADGHRMANVSVLLCARVSYNKLLECSTCMEHHTCALRW